ncbi:MAG: hypothetical protein ISR00_03250 [Flavobacteriales bacterium]|nr:hypothetical protein [Flavobacteriales bacterium]MBL6872950.1 hypothetical protein [Flavobacteriales bacterium]
MIKYIHYKDIDFQKWDACISNAVNRNIYASSWYLDLVCKNWDALILNDYEAVMPLPWNKKWGLKYIAQPLFCQQLGVFHQSDSIIVDDFLKSIPKSFLFVNMNLNTHNGKPRFNYIKNANYELYIHDYHLLKRGYSKSHLKNVSKAEKYTVEISSKAESPSDYLLRKSHEAKDFMTKEQLMMEFIIIENAIKKSRGVMFSASLGGENVSSIFLLKDGKRLTLLTSCTDAKGKKASAYFFLLDYIFSLEKFKGYIFDFEGSNIPGIAQRNKGFGAELTNYYTVKFNFLDRFFRFN